MKIDELLDDLIRCLEDFYAVQQLRGPQFSSSREHIRGLIMRCRQAKTQLTDEHA